MHYADMPYFNKHCGLRGNIWKYLILNIDFNSSETNIAHKRIRLKNKRYNRPVLYPWTIAKIIIFISQILSPVKDLSLERRLL